MAREGENLEQARAEPVRFVVVAGARTGSTMLVRALNSSPRIRCFGELFNSDVDFVPFDVEGYDNFSPRGRALRDSDFASFLSKRVFEATPPDLGAVGFKLLYDQERAFPGLGERLGDDRELRVVHLRRRNLLRALVSAKIAQRSGVWVEGPDLTVGGTLSPSNALRAVRHPLRAAAALGRRLRLATTPPVVRRAPVTMTADEATRMFRFIQIREIYYDTLFFSHPRLTVFYEDLVERPEESFGHVQSFLDLEPAPLTAGLRRQNPEPLRELIANYDELRAGLATTEHERFLE